MGEQKGFDKTVFEDSLDELEVLAAPRKGGSCFTAHIYFRGEAEDIQDIRAESYAALRTKNYLSLTAAYQEIWKAGVKHTLEKGQQDRANVDPRELAVLDELQRIRQMETKNRGYERIYKARGVDGFLEWSAETDQDVADFLLGKTLPQARPWSQRVLAVLQAEFRTREQIGRVEIEGLLIEKGLLRDDEVDKRKLKNFGYNYKLSAGGARGMWAWTSEAESRADVVM